MRNALFSAFTAFSVLLTTTGARAQSASPPAPADGLACFENLPAPAYPPAALQAHVDGSVWTWIQVSPQGSPGKIDTQVVSAWSDGAKLLTPPVETAIHAAKIKSACAGKTVRAVFRYQYGGEIPPDPKAAPETDGAYLMTIQSQPAKAARR
jgi:hypothetical protein